MIFLKKYYECLLITVLTVFFLVTGFTSLTQKAPTFDEIRIALAGRLSRRIVQKETIGKEVR